MQTDKRAEATDSTSAGPGPPDAGQIVGVSAEKDLKISEDLAVSSEMAVSDTLLKEMETLIMSEGLSCLEVDWLKRHRPAILKNIRAERIGLEKITEGLGMTIMWHEFFRAQILHKWKQLYETHGVVALTYKWLAEMKLTRVFTSLAYHKMTMNAGIESMGLTKELKAFHGPKCGNTVWSKEKFEEVTKDIIKEFGCFPPSEFLDMHGYGGFRSNIGRFGPTIADIRKRHNVQNVLLQSMDKQTWLSLPETACANYLIARGINVMKGESYVKEYAEQYERKSATYDMHFLGTVEPYMNVKLSVEIFGTGNYGGDNIRKKHYAETRRFKEDFHRNDKTFIAIEYKDCYSDARLSELLSPYIGHPPVQSGGSNRFNTTVTSLEEQVLQRCKDIKEKLQTSKLPTSAWFDRTGPYEGRPIHDWEPKSFATLVRNIERIKFSEVRRLLGEMDIMSHRIWTKKEAYDGYESILRNHKTLPSTLYNRLRVMREQLSKENTQLREHLSKLNNAVQKHFRYCRHELPSLKSLGLD